jgi:hypothetical protein
MMQHTWYFLQTYLFVADKKVVGCVVAVVIQEVSIIRIQFSSVEFSVTCLSLSIPIFRDTLFCHILPAETKLYLRSKGPGVAGIATLQAIFSTTSFAGLPLVIQQLILHECFSSEPVRARCGISRVWVLQQYRRKKIATRILDCVRYGIHR